MPYATAAQRYDVVCVGDVAADTFIRLPEGSAVEQVDERGRWLKLPFGAKVPFERGTAVAAGGTAANGAIALARLGMRVALATFLAHDEIGFDLVGALHSEHVDTRLVHVDSSAHTNRSFVLSFHGDRTLLVHHEEFEYHWPHLRPNEVPAWLYLTSVGRTALEYQDGIADWLDENPGVHLAFQPGTFQIEAGTERLARIYARAEVLLCARGEAAAIGGGQRDDPGDLLDHLLALGPSQVVVFDDAGGAVASDGDQRYATPPFPDTSAPLDRTGTEDAFGATLLAGLVRGMPLRDALRWPPVNFMSVSHELGSQAGLLHEKEIQSYLDEVGSGFDVRPL
jgi:sugar/nucleoside kinase (ribokinase family)